MKISLIALLLFALVVPCHSYIRQLHVCQSQTSTLSCPSSHIIRVIYAYYGGPSTVCPSANPVTTSCKNDSTDKLISECDNKNSCVLRATNANFGNPCPKKPGVGLNVLYVLGEGCSSPYIKPCEGSRCQRLINGIQVPNLGTRGFNIATLDLKSMKIKENKYFDTYISGNDQKLISWVSTIPDGTLLLLCSMDDATTSMSTAAWQALEGLGLKNPVKTYRGSHALIGLKGSSSISITRSNTTIQGDLPAIVSLAIVDPPNDAKITLAANNTADIAWNYTASRNAKLTVSYKSATAAVESTVQVDAELNKTTVGPLQSGVFNILTVSYGISNATNYYVGISFYVTVNSASSSNLGCPPGVHKFILEANGNSPTLDNPSSYWENDKTLNGMSVAFNGEDIKTSEYSTALVERMCVGLKINNILRFIEIPSPVKGKTFLQLMKEGATTNIAREKWLLLLPTEMRKLLQENCNQQGFNKKPSQPRFQKTRFGIIGNNEMDCYSTDSSFGFGPTKVINDYPFIQTHVAIGYIFIIQVVDGGWTSWSSWLSCSALSAVGITYRNRTCTNPSPINGQTCEGTPNEIKSCPPAAPTNLRGETKSQSQLYLTWDLVPTSDSANALSPIQKYILTLRRISEEIVTTRQYGPSTTSSNIYSLETYTKYCFTVNALLSNGVQGNVSTPYCLFTEESTPISAPKNFTGFNTSAWCLNFTWTSIPVSEARGIIVGYHIYLKTANINQKMYTTSDKNTSRICGLEPFTEYQVSIMGFTKFGEGGEETRSAWKTVKTDENVPIRAPTILSAGKISSTSIRLTWSQLEDNYWHGIPRGYKIYHQLVASTTPLTQEDIRVNMTDIDSWSTTTFDIKKLKKYREYEIWIAAYTLKGNGKNSTVVKEYTDEDLPSQGPSSVSVHNSSSFSLKVYWQSLNPAYRLGILLGYRIFCTSLKTGLETSVKASADAIITTIGNLEPFVNHSVKIAAFNIKGLGPNSSTAYASTDEYVPSRAPSDLHGYNLSSSIIFSSWSPIPKEFHQGILLGYQILWRNSANPSAAWNNTKVDRNMLNMTISHLWAYTNFTFKIAGYTSKGNGNFSSDVVISSGEDAPTKPPEKVYVSVNSSSTISISWSSPQSSGVPGIIRGYKISYKAVYTPEDFKSQLLARKKRRRRRAIISTPLEMNAINVTFGPNVHSAILYGLLGNTNYSVQILAYTISEGSWSQVIYIKTPETEPGMSPKNVTATATSYHSVMVTWQHVPPAYAHGYIKGYIVFYQQGNHSHVTSYNESQIAERTYLEITHLAIFKWHSFQVLAFTSAGLGVKSEVVYVRSKEWVPNKAPDGLEATSYYSPFQINVTWMPLAEEYWRGHRYRYQLTVYKIGVGGEMLHSSQKEKSIFTTNFTQTYFYLKAEPFTTYEINVRAQTVIGLGPASSRVHADSCNVDRSLFHTSWIKYRPFSTLQKFSITPTGIITSLLRSAVDQCYGLCGTLNKSLKIDFARDGTGLRALKSNYKEMRDKLSNETDFTFPLFKPRFKNQDFQFINILTVPAAMLLEAKLSPSEKRTSITVATSAVVGEIIIFFILCWLFGVLIWLLETWRKTDEFDRKPVIGIFEGFYWAYTTATTVGYGDKYPSSALGRILMMIWAFIGLILVSLLSGVLTAVLVAKEEIVPLNLGGSMQKPTGIGVVVESWEYYASLKQEYNIAKNYSSTSHLIEGMKKGEVRYGILDQYIAFAYQTKLKQNNITVNRKLSLKGSIGLYASGHAKKLRYCIEKYIEENEEYVTKMMLQNIQETIDTIKKEQQQSLKEETGSLMAKRKPEFYTWESKLMQFYIKLSAALLGTFFLFGCIYEILKYIWRRKKMLKIEPHQNFEIPDQEGFSAQRQWNIIRDIVLQSARDEKMLENETSYKSKLAVKKKKWNSLKAEMKGNGHNFCSVVVNAYALNKNVRYIKSLDINRGHARRPLFRVFQNMKVNIAIASLNMPGTLERETDRIIQEFRNRIEKKLSELDLKHSNQLVQKRKEMFKTYGAFKYIKETDLMAPY